MLDGSASESTVRLMRYRASYLARLHSSLHHLFPCAFACLTLPEQRRAVARFASNVGSTSPRLGDLRDGFAADAQTLFRGTRGHLVAELARLDATADQLVDALTTTVSRSLDRGEELNPNLRIVESSLSLDLVWRAVARDQFDGTLRVGRSRRFAVLVARSGVRVERLGALEWQVLSGSTAVARADREKAIAALTAKAVLLTPLGQRGTS